MAQAIPILVAIANRRQSKNKFCCCQIRPLAWQKYHSFPQLNDTRHRKWMLPILLSWEQKRRGLQSLKNQILLPPFDCLSTNYLPKNAQGEHLERLKRCSKYLPKLMPDSKCLCHFCEYNINIKFRQLMK